MLQFWALLRMTQHAHFTPMCLRLPLFVHRHVICSNSLHSIWTSYRSQTTYLPISSPSLPRCPVKQIGRSSSPSLIDCLSYHKCTAKAYREAHPDIESSEATKHAKLEETTCRQNSSTLPEYHTNCAKAIGRLLATASHSPNEVEEQATEPEPDSPNHGTQIGPYINATHWKHGISSTIYRAKDPQNNTTVALKLTTPSTMTAPHDSLREARILNTSKGSTIIPLLTSFHQNDRYILVFPFMPYDLNTLLHKTPQPLPSQTAKPLLHALFAGLAHLHSQGIIHRDIKPSNILLRTLHGGPAYIADFGTAWSPTDTASEPAAAKHLEVGTTSYRPPELLFGKTDYGPKLDMWAAGCVAAQVLGLGKQTLFESGDLGSELALIKSIFETLGTPDLGVWPEAGSLPDWGKMRFTEYPRKAWEEILPGVKDEERDLIRKLVVYESGDRLSAEEALRHPYFNDM